MAGPSVEFWQARFDDGKLPWDRGAPSPGLSAWLNSGTLPAGSRVLVPGCGRGWEVASLAAAGMQVTGIDYAPGALEACAALLAQAGLHADLQQADVLTWHPTQQVDAVWEQTCLCALHPDHWVAYARQLKTWLKPGGTLAAMFMQMPGAGSARGVIEGPPYHCDIHAMRALFTGEDWHWPKPPYSPIAHPNGGFELPVMLTRREAPDGSQ